MIYTTLKAIKEHSPCAEGWRKLMKHLGKSTVDNEPLPLVEILKSNGLNDAIWCFRAVDHKNVRLYAIACAREVQHLMTDARSLKALDVAEAYVDGKATWEDLEHARSAAASASADAPTSAPTYAPTYAATYAIYVICATCATYAATYAANAADYAADAAAAYAADYAAAAYAADYAAAAYADADDYAAYAAASDAYAAAYAYAKERQTELFIKFFGG